MRPFERNIRGIDKFGSCDLVWECLCFPNSSIGAFDFQSGRFGTPVLKQTVGISEEEDFVDFPSCKKGAPSSFSRQCAKLLALNTPENPLVIVCPQ